MGLLEKAGQIKSDKSPTASPDDSEIKSKKIIGTSVEPVAAEPIAEPQPVPAKKSRRKRAPRKKREPREKRVREAKVLPDGYEEASRSQKAIRRGSDFAVSYGWTVPLSVLTAWGSYFDPTYAFLLGLLLIGFNLGFMPYTTGRTVGNWISRTTFVTSKQGIPHQSYLFLKGLTFPMVLLGLILFLTSTSEGFGSKAGQVLLATSMVFLIPPFLDYLFYRFKRDDLGLWDTLYGGVWMVKTTKSAESKGWLKRLEQLGDYSESQGWWSDNESNEDPSAAEK